MSIRRCRALVLSLLFTFTLTALPVVAAPRDPGDAPVFSKIIKRIKIVFQTLGDGMISPTP